MTFKYSKKLDELESLAESKSGGRFSGFWSFIVAILRSRYILVSVCFYLVLIMILGGVVIYTPDIIRTTFEPMGGAFIRPPSQVEKAPAQSPRSKPDAGVIKQSLAPPSSGKSPSDLLAKAAANKPPVITTSSSPGPQYPFTPSQVQLPDLKPATPMAAMIEKERMDRWKRVVEYQDWVKKRGSGPFARDGNRGADVNEHGGDAGVARPGAHHDIYAEFVIFQAKYQDGDWNCNGPYSSGTNTWDLSALKNFMFQVRQWSRGRIQASVVPQVLDIGTDQLFTLKPPFIYLTGHKDFHFSEKEVKNLRDYLMLGGCIWADSALAGRRSRFDIAFRKEIKKVLPDRDFEILKPDHEMFNTYFRDVNLPAGINNYHEPAEIINIDDEIVVLYTMNGYGHFWESRLNRDGKIAWSPVNLGMLGRPSWLYVYGPHLGTPERAIIYRNVNDESVRDAYKFGINVLVCLLTQYDDKLKFLPKNFPVMDARQKPVM